MWPPWTTTQVLRKLRSRAFLTELGVDADLVDAWLAEEGDGALADEVRARIEGVPATYGHVIVDEAQDLSLLQLRAVQRRSTGLSLVGDDAQRSRPHALGLRRAAAELAVGPVEMTTAYRMSAEIADWLNAHASAARPRRGARSSASVRPGRRCARWPRRDLAEAAAELAERWPNVATITQADTWSTRAWSTTAWWSTPTGWTRAELYLAASRAAHELVIAR